MVPSRWGWRPSRSPAAFLSRSTSSPVRNSRGRSSSFLRRGGGSVLLTMVGALLRLAVEASSLLHPARRSVPFTAHNGTASHGRDARAGGVTTEQVGPATLAEALPQFQRSGAAILAVMASDGPDAAPRLIGSVHHIDVLRTLNRALEETAAEEHG